ncbi:hypothetical protein AVEN_13519-1 [Araneus ventricosus]|uniref:Uncharacterized protein n=1 Tax=Araneus ventricosus TaxID=182803 RepID=A0A4Y2LNX0_ARAVE|nr:hypothetical protein AVEN_13519-1 [Araneus ventricosus]
MVSAEAGNVQEPVAAIPRWAPCVGSYKLESIIVDCVSKYVRFLILSSSDKSRTLSTVSLFLIYKGITGIGGEPKAVRKLKSGDFLIETCTSTQTKYFLLAKTLLDIPI